jgi:hypothetical protein
MSVYSFCRSRCDFSRQCVEREKEVCLVVVKVDLLFYCFVVSESGDDVQPSVLTYFLSPAF